MKRLLQLFSYLLISLFSRSQLLTGSWNGSSSHSILVLNPTSITLEIEEFNDSLITGIAHYYYKKDRYEHVKISGRINWKDSLVNIVEEDEISHNLNTKIYDNCLGNIKLSLLKLSNSYQLKGEWKDKSRKLFHCPDARVVFEKPFIDTFALIKNTALNSSLSRKTDIQKIIEITNDETDSIKCSLYDNGEIDNDTISLYFNDSLIVKEKRVSQIPIEFYLPFDKQKTSQKIKLIAENLGLIPPNTALLIITTRKNRYSITLSSDYSQNASVEFFLKQ